MLGTCAAVVIAALMACATWQTSFWRDEETLWRHALSCTTDNVKAEVGLADALMRRGQLDQAVPYYRRALEHPIDFVPFLNLGLCLARQGKVEEALGLFRRAVEIEPNSYEPHVSLGLGLAVTNRLDESMQQFRRALEIDPLGVNAHCGVAYVLRRQGDVAGARVEFERAIEIDPRKVPARIDLASLLLEQGEIEAAIPQLEAALAIDPKQAAAQINLARALAGAGESARPPTITAAPWKSIPTTERHAQASISCCAAMPNRRGPEPQRAATRVPDDASGGDLGVSVQLPRCPWDIVRLSGHGPVSHRRRTPKPHVGENVGRRKGSHRYGAVGRKNGGGKPSKRAPDRRKRHLAVGRIKSLSKTASEKGTGCLAPRRCVHFAPRMSAKSGRSPAVLG